MAGIAIDDECVTAFNELKAKKSCRYITYQIIDNTAVKVCNKGARDKSWDDFVAEELKDNQPLYAVFDFDFKNDEGADRNKIVIFSWIPDNLPVKMMAQKMIYASTKESFAHKIGGGGTVSVAANDKSQTTLAYVTDKCNKGR